MCRHRENDSAAGLRLHALLGVPRIFHDPASAALGDSNLEISRLATGKNADSLAQVSFQIKIGRLLEVRIERRRPQKAVELEMANAVFPWRYYVGGGDAVQA